VRDQARKLLDEWCRVVKDLKEVGVPLQYQKEVGEAPCLLYDFLAPELKNLPPQNPKMRFRAPRSMRDVEPSVNLWMKTMDGREVEDEE
jgi:hypothetical protein